MSKVVGSVVTEYCYDGDQIIAEYQRVGAGSPVLVRKYIYGPGIDEPVAMIDCTGQQEVWYYYHFDGCGNVVALSNSNSQIVEAYSYDHFGAPVVMTGPGTDGVWATYGDNLTAAASQLGNPYMFTGRQYDPETGLYYYRARYYHPALGRFLQTDPIGYAAGLNLYSYCGNNPPNWADPWGLYGYSSNLGIGNNILANISEAVGDLGAVCGSDLATAYSEGIGDGCAILANAITGGFIPSWNATANAKRCEYGWVGEATTAVSNVGANAVQTLFLMRAFQAVGTWLTRPASIPTPYGVQTQGISGAAQNALGEAKAGATLYRTGALGESMAAESQFWSLQNPLTTPGYGTSMGLPSVTPNYVMGGTLSPSALAVTNAAGPLGANLGGGIQVVTSQNGVQIIFFVMP